MNCLFKKWKNILKYFFLFKNLLARAIRRFLLFDDDENFCRRWLLTFWMTNRAASFTQQWNNASCHHHVETRKPSSFRPIFSEERPRDDAIVDSGGPSDHHLFCFLVDCCVDLLLLLSCCCYCCHHWCFCCCCCCWLVIVVAATMVFAWTIWFYLSLLAPLVVVVVVVFVLNV